MKTEKGMVTLEACVALLLFMIIMLLMYGLFPMYMAQSATAHALLQTSQSLALDNYAAKQVGEGKILGEDGVKDVMVLLVGDFLNIIPESDSGFATNKEFTEKTDNVPEIAKKRFVSYLVGDDSSEAETKADEMLKLLRVEGGLSGLDFSDSKVEGEDLKIILKYKLNYAFELDELGKADVYQETSSKLWS